MALPCPNCQATLGFVGVGNEVINGKTMPVFRCRNCHKNFKPLEIYAYNKLKKIKKDGKVQNTL